MESFFSRYKNALVLIAVLVAQLLALAVQVKRPASDSADQQGVTLIRYVVVSVVTPPERWLHNLGRGIRGLWSGYLDLVHVRQEDAELRTKIERLQLEQASLAEDAKQGQRLQQLLDFKQHYLYKTLPAQVIGTSGTDQSRTVFIDKGAKDGLATDMPVVTADGIVGKLKDVFDHKSQVLMISDRTSGVGVTMETTRTRGILKGSPFGELRVINISPDERIKPGERIVTSGGDQIFPRGMPVGTVDRIVPDPERDPWVDVVIRPAANLSRLEEVLVITNVGETASEQETKDLAESEAEGAAEQKRASDVLSERLPGRVDAKAPAETNPDTAADNSGENVRLMTPPRPVRPDQYSPDATPQAEEMTPGERRAPVLQGTEDIVAPAKKPAVATPTSPTTGDAAKGDSSVPGTAAKKSVPTTGSTTVPATKTAASTTGTKPATGTVAGSGIAVGTAANVGKPAKTTNGNSLQSGSAASSTGSTRPSPGSSSGTASASMSGSNAAGAQLKTKVIVDGPIRDAGSGDTRAGASQASVAPAKKKAPEIVPDDGSRPPGAEKPVVQKPKPAVQPSEQNSQPAQAPPPNGGRQQWR